MIPARPQSGDPVIAARRAFARFARGDAAGVAFAPGRVNLVGEHTDYNDGFVLPMAIAEGVAAAFASRSDRVLRVHAADFHETCEVSLDALDARTAPSAGWFRYVSGTAWAMTAGGAALRGADVALAADLPIGAGLSSSAAVELVTARVLAVVAGIPWEPRAAALAAQRGEQEFAGVSCGIMDQLVVACATEGHALLIDCRSLDTRQVALPAGAAVVVMNSGIQRSLASSAYNDRRLSCERAVRAIREVAPAVRALRDVDASLLECARDGLDEVTLRRAAHVVAENARPEAFAAALARGDFAAAGRVLLDSHVSLRDLYEVSCPELDALVSIAMEQPGCFGARLTGAGFGGCALALVDAAAVPAFVPAVVDAYRAETGIVADVILGKASEGARLCD